MTKQELYQRAGDYYTTARENLEPVYVRAQSECDRIGSRVMDAASTHFISEVWIFNALLITFGMLIASLFSDFFKKYRAVVAIAFVAACAGFVYKAWKMVGEWEETDSF